MLHILVYLVVYLFTSPGFSGEREIIEILLSDTPLLLSFYLLFPNEHVVYASSYYILFFSIDGWRTCLGAWRLWKNEDVHGFSKTVGRLALYSAQTISDTIHSVRLPLGVWHSNATLDGLHLWSGRIVIGDYGIWWDESGCLDG